MVHSVEDRGRGFATVIADDLSQSLFAEFIALRVHGVGNAVAEDHKHIAWSEPLARLVILHHWHDAERAAAGIEPFYVAVGAQQQRRIVAGVCKNQLAR